MDHQKIAIYLFFYFPISMKGVADLSTENSSLCCRTELQTAYLPPQCGQRSLKADGCKADHICITEKPNKAQKTTQEELSRNAVKKNNFLKTKLFLENENF